MRKKLCIVIQRYGNDIVGGAETYCRIYAERLSKIYDIEVVTTCALDHNEWKNYYNEGEELVNGVKVKRFKVDKYRDNESFAEITPKILSNPYATREADIDWIDRQGPVCYGLIKYIEENKENYDLFIFMTYLYYHTVMGMGIVKDKSILVPFAHDEPPIYLNIYNEIFNLPKGIVYNTEEERDFIQNKFDNQNIPSILTGIGIDILDTKQYNGSSRKYNLDFPYIVYMGRIQEAKGCHKLFDYFLKFKENTNNNLKLVLTGKSTMKLPKSKDIISLGFVSEEEKFDILSNSLSFVIASQYESLSIVVLEAFSTKRPVLVSGACEVLKGHCVKSNGGLYFYGYEDFYECLELLLENEKLASGLGENGFNYVIKNYQWDIIMDKLTRFIDEFIKGD